MTLTKPTENPARSLYTLCEHNFLTPHTHQTQGWAIDSPTLPLHSYPPCAVQIIFVGGNSSSPLPNPEPSSVTPDLVPYLKGAWWVKGHQGLWVWSTVWIKNFARYLQLPPLKNNVRYGPGRSGDKFDFLDNARLLLTSMALSSDVDVFDDNLARSESFYNSRVSAALRAT